METKEELIETCARAAHEVNRAYCARLGDLSHESWERSPESLRASTRAGVEVILRRPVAVQKPSDLHRRWREYKEAEGWVYGEVKDLVAKTHPNLRPFEELPVAEQMKDHLFLATVATTMMALLQTFPDFGGERFRQIMNERGEG